MNLLKAMIEPLARSPLMEINKQTTLAPIHCPRSH